MTSHGSINDPGAAQQCKASRGVPASLGGLRTQQQPVAQQHRVSFQWDNDVCSAVSSTSSWASSSAAADKAKKQAAPATAAASTTRAAAGAGSGAAALRQTSDCDDFAQYMTSVAARELEECPGHIRQHLRDLKVLRTLQILCTCAFIVMGAMLLATLGSISSTMLSRSLKHHSPQDPTHLRREVARAVDALMLLVASGLGLSLPCLALDMVWLIFTVNPRRRECARTGQCTRSCSRYTCDMSWDIACALMWAAILALTCVSVVVYAGDPIQVQVVLALVLLALHITTAVISAVVRKAWKRVDSQIDRVVELRRGVCVSDALSASII